MDWRSLERRADIAGVENVPAPPAAKFANAKESDVNQPDKVKEGCNGCVGDADLS